MKLLTTCWIALLELFDALSSTPRVGRLNLQEHLQPQLDVPSVDNKHDGHPIFSPPSRPENPDTTLKCDYSAKLDDWQPCSTPDDRGCWLRGPQGQRFDIATNYEKSYPPGTTRKYTLTAGKKEVDADGVLMRYGKVFNNEYPGPWIQITVKNDLQFNGTTIHWHGLRQLGSLEMDGVNAVTQCPIAPGHNYTYRFRAMQYGTSWYHSHYSLQYGDGMVGPMTIYGPSSSNYDEAKDPILMTDWNHRSGFQDFQKELLGSPPKMTSILLNGLGSYAGGAKGGLKYNTTFERGRKYLLRLINTSVDTTFVFSIDLHNLTVMSSDFVPIVPYITDHVVVGIGQRYHVVVDALAEHANDDTQEYWIRTIPAKVCSNFELGGVPDERQGIVYYQKNSSAYPTTPRGNFSIDCRDEDPKKLTPVLRWDVPKPQVVEIKPNENFFEVGIDAAVPGHGRPLPNDTFARWAIGPKTLWLNFSDPTIVNLNSKMAWNPDWVVIPKDYPEDSWIYMIITSSKHDLNKDQRVLVPAAHPSDQKYRNELLDPNYDNPPRRDVVLLPADGFVVIAFKADNPGAWLLHCHIAWHASSGLALQILERQPAIAKEMTPERLAPVYEGCNEWKTWFANESNYYHPEGGAIAFQDDSGV